MKPDKHGNQVFGVPMPKTKEVNKEAEKYRKLLCKVLMEFYDVASRNIGLLDLWYKAALKCGLTVRLKHKERKCRMKGKKCSWCGTAKAVTTSGLCRACNGGNF